MDAMPDANDADIVDACPQRWQRHARAPWEAHQHLLTRRPRRWNTEVAVELQLLEHTHCNAELALRKAIGVKGSVPAPPL